jgi:hypothetical protein
MTTATGFDRIVAFEGKNLKRNLSLPQDWEF